MIEKVILSIASSILFSLILGFITYFSSGLKDQTSILSHFPVYLIFSLPIFIFAGAPFSYFIETYIEEKNYGYIIKLLLYCVGGIILGSGSLILIANNLNDAKWSAILTVSIGAAMIYYHLLLLNNRYQILSKLFKK